MQGLHLTADLYLCACPTALLTDAAGLADLCRSHTLEADLTLVGEKWHTFPETHGQPGGVTGMLLLAESHLAIHTWPERNGVTLDVYVCNFTGDNSAKAEQLLYALEQMFLPGKAQRQRLLRGGAHGPEEREAFFYHEALVHPAAMAHPSPRTALVLGGGDGGAAEELLKHPSIEAITLVERDAQVINIARHHPQGIHRGALDDPRIKIHIETGATFVAHCQKRFDLVLLDLTDTEILAAPLYTQDFLIRCQDLLAPGGALVLHLGSPFHSPNEVRNLAAGLAAIFTQVHGYGLHIPRHGAYWALAVASDTLRPAAINAEEVQRRLVKRGIGTLQYYNAEVHGALFALPNFYRALMPASPVKAP